MPVVVSYAEAIVDRGNGVAAARPVDPLVQFLTDPSGETAQRFRATAGLTSAGP